MFATRRLGVERYEGAVVQGQAGPFHAIHGHLVDALFAARAAWGA